MNEQVRTGFMCLTDFRHELGEARGGIQVYASEAEVRLKRPCTAPECDPRCGIVEVEVRVKRVIDPGVL